MRRYDKGKRPYDRQDQRRGYPESDAYEPERGSRLFRGAQEFQVGNSKQELTPLTPRRYRSPHRHQTFSPNVLMGNKGAQRVESFLDEQSRQPQCNPGDREMIQGTEPDLTSSSERMQDDPVTALQQARALVAASDPEVPTKLPKSWKMDKPASNDRVKQQEWLPPPIQNNQPSAPFLPSSLRRHYDPGEGDPPLELHPSSVNPGDEEVHPVHPFKMQEQSSHVDNKDRPLTVRDMEHFTKAIQTTIREMGSEFIEALAEMRQSEDIFDDYEDE